MMLFDSSCRSGVRLGLAAATLLSGAWQVTAQEVEIISGTTPRVSVDQTAPGIRVIAFADPAANTTEHRILTPLLPDEIRSVQQNLATAGYDAGVADGFWGPATELALGAFQDDRGFAVCSCVDYRTAMSLGLRPLIVQTVIGAPEAEGEAEVVHGRVRAPLEWDVPPQVIEVPPETVIVVQPVGNYWGYPAFFGGFRPVAPTPPVTGFPIGRPIRLGPGSGRPPS